MTNAELIQAIKAEIERRIKELDEQIVDIYDSKAVLRKDELQRLLSFLNSIELKKPVPKDLEEAARKFVGYDMDCDELRDYEMGIASFIAGHNLYREQILKDAVEKTVGQLERQWGGNIHFMHGFEVDEMDFPFLNSQECGYGDKVRVIILPKEE